MTRLSRGEAGRRYDHQFQLRLPKSLFDRIKAFAQAKEQAVNSEIVAALATAYPAPIVPESVNGALFEAASAVLDDWGQMLAAIGQDPASNPKIQTLADALKHAERQKGGA